MVEPTKGLELERWSRGPNATFGQILLSSGVLLYTVERPWLDNRPRVSCIPTGHYVCLPRKYHAGDYDAIEVTGVDNRTHILFHKANCASELAGCIAPGMDLGCLRGEWAVVRSGEAFGLLMEEVGGQTWRLGIENMEEKT